MFAIELIERKVGSIDSKVIPLDNLCSEDLDRIKAYSGNMTEEIYSHQGQTDRVRSHDRDLITIDTVRIFAVKECILLWTIVQGNTKKYPHMDQLAAWLNETKHTHKGDLLIIEREVHEPSEVEEGPECLFGEDLEEAMKTAPRGKTVESSDDESIEDALTQMSDEDLAELFDSSENDLSLEIEEGSADAVCTTPSDEKSTDFVMTDRRTHDRRKEIPFEVDFEVDKGDDDIEKALEEFFSPIMEDEPTLWLTEEVV